VRLVQTLIKNSTDLQVCALFLGPLTFYYCNNRFFTLAEIAAKLEQDRTNAMLLCKIDVFNPFYGHSFSAVTGIYYVVVAAEIIQFPGILTI